MQARDLDLLGALTAIAFYVSAILVFVFRLARKPQVGFWLGLFEFALAIPLLYLQVRAPAFGRPALYYVQIGLMLLWLAVMLVLDYILQLDFRQTRWMVIGFVMLFFAGSGGMLGIASAAGRGWSLVSIGLFLVMAVLAFVQRKITGM